MKELENFWTSRYQDNRTGWDIGSPSTPLKEYIDQLEDKSLKILIPGAGNAYEAAYLLEKGFKNVFIIDIVKEVVDSFRNKHPELPADQAIHGDFFAHDETYDLILEQTFFCSFPPHATSREAYAKKTASLLKPHGKLVGLWFIFPLTDNFVKRPFGGSVEEYLEYFQKHYSNCHMEACYNSIQPRAGKEVFGIFEK